MNKNVTLVTGLWDLGRGKIEGWGKRDFQQYKDRFFELLRSDAQMCIWIPKELEQEAFFGLASQRRKKLQERERATFAGQAGISTASLAQRTAGAI